MASRIYDFTLAASIGATQRLDVMASRVKILSCSYPVEVRTDTGDVYSLLSGQGFNLPTGKTFREVVLRNTVAAAQSGTLFIGDESFEDSRITGEVNIIDGERLKVLAGYAFSAVAQVTGSTGSPFVQLWNAPGSGKNLFVQSVSFGLSAADSWGISSNTNILNLVPPNAPFNVDASSVASPASALRYDNLAQTLIGVQPYKIGYALASTDRFIEFKRPILLRPGRGLLVFANALTTTIRASFEFEEWPI